MNQSVILLAAALRAYDRTFAQQQCGVCGATWEGQEDDCHWCLKRRQTDHDWILKPPPARGYGYATPEDLVSLGYDRNADRKQDLERWRMDLQLAADAGLITEQEGQAAWESATKNQPSSKSSTGKNSTTAPTTNKTPSSKALPTVAAGQPSPPRRKPANRRLSLPYRWHPADPAPPF